VLKRKKPQESSQDSGASYSQAALSWKTLKGNLSSREFCGWHNCFSAASNTGKALRPEKGAREVRKPIASY
jgi:hypothetical protein